MSLVLAKNSIDLGIVTKNPAAMLGFYRDLLGLPLQASIDMPGGGTMHRLQAGDSIVKIVELSTEPPAAAAPGGIRAATGYRYWTLTVSNLQESVDACEQAGHRIMVAPKSVRPGVTIAIIEDPDGNWVEFLQND